MLIRTEETLPLLRSPRDALSRPLRDLRLSVLDRCNFRCSYCMPEAPETIRKIKRLKTAA